MSRADEFRMYAEEAMRWARHSNSADDKAVLIDLARTWEQAASYRESIFVEPPEVRRMDRRCN